MKNQERRGHWYLLTGLIIGLAIGLLYAWIISPIQYIDTTPDTLAASYKDDYRQVIAQAYQASGDIGRARERAILIDPENPARAIAAQAQRLVAANSSPIEARALAVLASDLGQQQSPASASGSATSPPAAEVPSETAQSSGPQATPTATLDQSIAIQTPTAPLPTATPTITLTTAPTFTPRPTATPPEVEDAPFTLSEDDKVCDGSVQPGILLIQVNDAEGQPLPGIRISVSWPEGEDIFFTGLISEVNPGFADYQMKPGEIYDLKVGEASEAISDLSNDGRCGWKMSFTQ